MKFGKRFAVTLAVACLALGSGAAGEEQIGQNVFVNDMNLSGMDYEQASALVEERVEQMRADKITVQVGEDSVDVTASELGLQWENKDVVREAMALGNSGNIIKRYKDRKNMEQGAQVLNLEFGANENLIRAFVEDCKQFEQEPREASISADGGGGFNLTPGQPGQTLDVEESVKIVQDYIANQWTGGSGTVALAVAVEEPKGSTKDLETIQDMLGTYTTPYGSTYGRNLNVERGAELINDHVIWPGETFSVCEHLVPFTAENGYELAPEYAMGRVVQGYGGGICQVSTTLYNAALLAELEIVERHNHTMTVSYVPASMDAAIAEGAMDLVLRNNKETPVLISGYAYGGELTFTIWGKETRPADRYVSYYSVVTSETAADGVALFAAPDQPVGYLNQVQSPMGGMTAECWKSITYNGETTEEQVNSSMYEATPASYEVGTLGATDALLNAIYANDLASVQLAITGETEQTESETQATETTAPDTTDPAADPNAGYTDPNAGYVDPNAGYTDPSAGYTDPNAGYVDSNAGYTDPNAGYTDGSVYIGDGTGSDGVITW